MLPPKAGDLDGLTRPRVYLGDPARGLSLRGGVLASSFVGFKDFIGDTIAISLERALNPLDLSFLGLSVIPFAALIGEDGIICKR